MGSRTLVPLTREHLWALPRLTESLDRMGLTVDQVPLTPGAAVVNGTRVLGVGGLLRMPDGTWKAWGMPQEQLSRAEGIALARLTKRWLEAQLDSGEFPALLADFDLQDLQVAAWARFLGFRKESPCPG